jgi:hypothetical protein
MERKGSFITHKAAMAFAILLAMTQCICAKSAKSGETCSEHLRTSSRVPYNWHTHMVGGLTLSFVLSWTFLAWFVMTILQVGDK